MRVRYTRSVATIAVFVLLGFALSLAVAWSRALTVDIVRFEREYALLVEGGEQWLVFRRRSPAAERIISDRRPARKGATSTDLHPLSLVPQWCGYRHPTRAYATRARTAEPRIAFGFGWPFIAWWFEDSDGRIQGGIPVKKGSTVGPVPSPDRVLPLRPAWSGVALNTASYTAFLALVVLGPRAVRRASRRARDRCEGCAYPLRGSDRCPECGRVRR